MVLKHEPDRKARSRVCKLSAAAMACLTMSFLTPTVAQKLPPPSRTVFKCESAGKTVYSDAPCIGAVKVDVEPTRGLNKSSGHELVGKDVQHERSREAFADAVRPVTGMDSKQLDVRTRRMKLSAEDQRECQRLDSDVAAAEADERSVSRHALIETQTRLFGLRKQYAALGC